MYKVFIDNAFLQFKKSDNFSTNLDKVYLPALKTNQLKAFVADLKKSSKYISADSIEGAIKSFFSNFKWIEASGGVVQHESNHRFLFIYRNGIWDLPKGKIEKKEGATDAALREVKEECGLVTVEITEELSPTFHVYFAFGRFWIKKTHWFKMTSPDQKLIPQTEEGITQVNWCNSDEIKNILNTTFASLRPIIEIGTAPES